MRQREGAMPRLFDRDVLKRLLALQSPIAILVGLIIWGAYHFETKADLARLMTSERTIQKMHKDEVRASLRLVASGIRSEAKSNELRDYLATGNRARLDSLASEWSGLLEAAGYLDSIRYMDGRGMELLRVNMAGGVAYTVPPDALQDKSLSYYYRDATGLSEGEVYVSPFDLNVENGQIEKPNKPIIRFVTRVYGPRGEPGGLIVMNYLGEGLIKRFRSKHADMQGSPILLDSEGNWIIAPDASKEWCFMRHEHEECSFTSEYPGLWAQISASDSGQFMDERGLYTFSTIYPLDSGWRGRNVYVPDERLSSSGLVGSKEYYWKSVSHLPGFAISQMSRSLMMELLTLYAVIFVILGAISWWLARLWSERAAAAIRISEAKEEWDRTFDSITDPIMILDTGLRIVKCNLALAGLLGASPRKLAGRSCKELICGNSVSKEECPCLSARLEGKAQTQESFMNRLGGYFYIAVSPIYGMGGKITGYVHYMRDITRRREMEQELIASERSLANAQRIAHIGSWNWDIKSGEIVWSNETYRMFGLRPYEVSPCYEAFISVVHPEDREALSAAVNAALHEHKPYSINHRVVRPDGEIRHVHEQGEVAFDSSGKPLSMSGTVQDITEARLMEEGLKYSESFLKSVIENEPECVKLIDEDCRLISMNPAGLAMIEVDDVGPFVGQSMLPMVLPEHRDAFAEFTRGVCRGRSGTITFEVQGMKGARLWLESHAVPFYDAKRDRTVLLGVTRDITERKRAEDGLRQALADKDVLIKEVHHRVKNNLMIIQSLLKLQQSEVRDEGSRRKFEESGNRVRSMGMIHEMLYKSADLKSIDFAEYAGGLARSLVRGSAHGDKSVRLDLEMEHMPMDVDTVIPCGLILNELVTNALKYAFRSGDDSGALSVKCSKADDGLITFVVKDNGPGLPQGFDMNSSDTLGMRIISSLAAQIEAEVEIASQGGASFTLRFRDRSPAED